MKLATFIFHDVLRHDASISGFTGGGAEWYKLSLARFTEILDIITGASQYPLEQLAEPAAVRPRSDATLLTFDDGGASSLDPIARTLECRGLRGRFFVVTSCLGRPGFISARQCRELAERGHIIGSHSETHAATFSRLPLHLQIREWHNSRTALEQIVGASITSASVPFGDFSRNVARSAAEAGYQLLFTSEPLIHPTSGPGGLLVAGRYMVTRATGLGEVEALARCARISMAQRWFAWNARKALKRTMRPLYERLRVRMTAGR